MTGDAQLEPDAELRGFADEYGLSLASARSLVGELRAQAGAGHFYIFWTAGSGGGASSGARQRMLLAFPTPDAALAFAQRNQLPRAGEQPRLRRLSLLQLIQAVLREPAIGTLLVVADSEDDLIAAGQLPRGVRFERPGLMSLLQSRIDS